MFIFLILQVPALSLAGESATYKALNAFFKQNWKLNESSLEYLEKGEVLSEADVSSDDKTQSFTLNGAGLHKNRCSTVLRKLSMLEKYEDWISFIKSSKYNEKRRLFTVKADHTLLPYPMIVHIIMDRPTKPGVYKYAFPTGMFAGLIGTYTIKDINNRCLIYAESSWRGKKTAIPNMVIKLFVEGLSKTGAELLIRKTRF